MYEHLEYEVADPVAIIRLNRPDRLNAFTYKTLEEIRHAVLAANDDPAVFGIIITGNGRGFSAGLDSETLAEAAGGGPTERRNEAETPGLFTYFWKVQKPIIAAVNGPAAGGGFVMAVMADVRFASPEAMFTTVFSKRGLVSEHGTSWIMPRLIGAGRSLDMLWSSRKVGAEEALRIGLVEYLTGSDDLVDQARAYVADLAANVSAASIRDTKQMVYDHMGIEYDPALREAQMRTDAALSRSDSVEGVESFVERRPPNFKRLGTD
jgi:enoyl-CoA hydratase/carnithine racemase